MNPTQPSRMLFIKDLLNCNHLSKSNMFEFGSPSFIFNQVRVFGTVIKKKNERNYVSVDLDDSTAIIEVRVSMIPSEFKFLTIGVEFECVGILKEVSRGVRIVDVVAWDMKEDPAYDLLRPLEIIWLYKTNYFHSKFPNLKDPSDAIENQFDDILFSQSDNSDISEKFTPLQLSQELPFHLATKVVEFEKILTEFGGRIEWDELKKMTQVSETDFQHVINNMIVNGIVYKDGEWIHFL